MNPILLAVLASFFWGVGTVMQKHGMATSFPQISLAGFIRQVGSILLTLVRNWLWVLGLLFMIGGMVSYATALGAADLSIVQPIICLTGVVAAVIGVTFLKEKVRPVEWLGIALILGGVVIVSVGATGETARIPGNGPLLAFTAVSVVLIAASFMLKRLNVSVEMTLSLAAGLNFGLANLMGKLLTQRVILDVDGPFSFARPEVWWSLITDYPVFVIIATNIVGGAALQTAFANGRASVVSPVVTIISTILPILAALTIFGENVRVAHAVGIGVVIFGTTLLALRGEEPAPATA
ncbi:MAG: EamA family transporter [Candidatus Lernaella stagnicola]|nr:EamA family transporter [Candidatus Lernaella stagnicola]